MKVAIVIKVCHMMIFGNVAAPVCHEDVQTSYDASACVTIQSGIADWKAKSPYAGDEWWVARYSCTPGGRDYPNDQL